MKISFPKMHFWRFSLNKIQGYPFYKCKNKNELHGLTVDYLTNNEDISLWLDALLNRTKGYHINIVHKKSSSKLRRQLDYISQVLISTVIKNDIGIQGAIAPIYVTDASEKCSYINMKLPLNVRFMKLDNNYKFSSLINERTSSDEYLIPYTSNENRKTLSKQQIEKLNKISNEIIFDFVRNNKISFESNCCFFAIDYFINNDKIQPIEWHIPGRGIGLHIIPFMQDKKCFNKAALSVNSFRNDLAFYYNSDIELLSKNSRKTDFHILDECFIDILNANKSTVLSKTIKLDVNDSNSEFHERLFHGFDLIQHIIVDKELCVSDVPNIKNRLGEWVILKSELNIPWWSAERLKPEIHLTEEKLIKRINNLLKKYNSLIIQELITDSIDNYGNFGELRSYFLLMK
jgi:hypothetical protein